MLNLQGTTADHIYVEHTRGFPICTVVLLMQKSILQSSLEASVSPVKGRLFFPKTLLRYIYLTNNQRTAAFIPQDGLESCSAVRPFSSVDEWWLSLASSNRKNYCLK